MKVRWLHIIYSWTANSRIYECYIKTGILKQATIQNTFQPADYRKKTTRNLKTTDEILNNYFENIHSIGWYFDGYFISMGATNCKSYTWLLYPSESEFSFQITTNESIPIGSESLLKLLLVYPKKCMIKNKLNHYESKIIDLDTLCNETFYYR